jgi:hypothetical protein
LTKEGLDFHWGFMIFHVNPRPLTLPLPVLFVGLVSFELSGKISGLTAEIDELMKAMEE